jgi:hypothetical protein
VEVAIDSGAEANEEDDPLKYLPSFWVVEEAKFKKVRF